MCSADDTRYSPGASTHRWRTTPGSDEQTAAYETLRDAFGSDWRRA